ncbi:hypothetical protein Syun_012175 [Stephania yunnanensis]|uniref:Transposase MuDR plant domain-containing protein n=1 Tax=Stephania yunnanensis TaxID=152371 RepID=A0AAP0K000_9MAGN
MGKGGSILLLTMMFMIHFDSGDGGQGEVNPDLEQRYCESPNISEQELVDLEVGHEEEVEPLEEQDNETIQQEELQENEGNDFFDSDNDVEDDDDYQEDVDEQPQGRRGGRGRPNVIAPPRSSALAIVEVHDQDSDYTTSDGLHTDDDSDGSGKTRYLEFDEFKDMTDPHLELGMKFSSFKTFKMACRNCGIQNKRQIRFITNDKKMCICQCQRFKSSNCEF